MTELVPPIRNTARAIIFREQQILLLQKGGDELGERYVLPGGAQEPGEILIDALQRECQEEINTEVSEAKLIHVAEFYKFKDTQPLTRRHVVDFLFDCKVPDDYIPSNGYHPDKHQLDVVWRPLAELENLQLFPEYLNDLLPNLHQLSECYLGMSHAPTPAT